MTSETYTPEQLLKPFDFNEPVNISRIFDYLTSFEAVNLPWYQEVTVLAHIANVALFSRQIAKRIQQNGIAIDVQRVKILGWLRDIGRVPWGIAERLSYKEITNKYGHHGFLGYKLLTGSGVAENFAIISMTHIGSGVSASEVQEINSILGVDIFPVRDWYAKTLEEMVVIIADKIPGWNNTVLKPWQINQTQDKEGVDPKERKGNKIYSWLPNQTPLWNRFWGFKERVDQACDLDCLTLFDQGLLSSDPESYRRLPKPEEIVKT